MQKTASTDVSDLIPLDDLLVSPAPTNHLVQFYGAPDQLAANVVVYLTQGIRNGERLVLIATSAHRDRFVQGLVAGGTDVAALVRDGGLLMFDAEETLAKLMAGDEIDEAAFDRVVGCLIAGIEGRVRAYGEMVDLLWKSGRLSAAIRLEECWNRLLKAQRFTLYCAYAVELLATNVGPEDLQSMVECHSHLLPVRRNGELEHAVRRAMQDVLGTPTVESLAPFIQATRYGRSVVPGGEATVLWIRKSLPPYADEILDRARGYYETACRAATPSDA